MKRNIYSLLGFSLHATDGLLGTVEDFYFDDNSWTVRYLVVKIHRAFFNRKVLITPDSITPCWEDGAFPVNLTTEQILNSPDRNRHKPVSRHHEALLNSYYWQPYWDNGFYAPASCDESNDDFLNHRLLSDTAKLPMDDDRLQSTRQLIGYEVQATDGKIGRLTDFVIDDNIWKVTCLIVAITEENGFRNVLIPVSNVKKIMFSESRIYLNISTIAVAESENLDTSKFTIPTENAGMYV